MDNVFDSLSGEFLVLVNDEAQYSLWPAFQPVPAGWRVARVAGPREECQAWIEDQWKDLLPLSLQRIMSPRAPRA